MERMRPEPRPPLCVSLGRRRFRCAVSSAPRVNSYCPYWFAGFVVFRFYATAGRLYEYPCLYEIVLEEQVRTTAHVNRAESLISII